MIISIRNRAIIRFRRIGCSRAKMEDNIPRCASYCDRLPWVSSSLSAAYPMDGDFRPKATTH